MSQTPREQVRSWVEGYRQTALIAAAVRSGLLDALQGRSLAAEHLAAERGWPVVMVRRLLRGLELLQVVARQSEEASDSPRFGLTAAGELLCADAPGPEHPYALLSAEQYVPAWLRMDAALYAGTTPFEVAFGQPVWEHRRADPAAGAVFNQWLFRQSGRVTDQLVSACEIGDSQLVADVGGGQGALLIDLLRAHPGLRGVLADQPAVVAAAEDAIAQAGLATRCETRGIDFFQAVPAGCDLYLLKSVLHDWNDDDCVRILRSIRQALSATARLLVIERLVPEVPQQDPETIWLDLHMLCVTGGCERTRDEYRGLLAAAGLALRRVIKTNGPFRVLEAGLPAGS